MTPTLRRRLRWALNGALILALVAIVLGGFFSVMLAMIEGRIPAGAGAGFWAELLLYSSLIWGGGALFFGAILGLYASLIWRDSAE